ncbi:hypothetical protein V5F40_06830 [Xanthobacter sp. DSM 14520]
MMPDWPHASTRRRPPLGFGDPPRSHVRLAPVFIAAGVLGALFIHLLRSL